MISSMAFVYKQLVKTSASYSKKCKGTQGLLAPSLATDIVCINSCQQNAK